MPCGNTNGEQSENRKLTPRSTAMRRSRSNRSAPTAANRGGARRPDAPSIAPDDETIVGGTWGRNRHTTAPTRASNAPSRNPSESDAFAAIGSHAGLLSHRLVSSEPATQPAVPNRRTYPKFRAAERRLCRDRTSASSTDQDACPCATEDTNCALPPKPSDGRKKAPPSELAWRQARLKFPPKRLLRGNP